MSRNQSGNLWQNPAEHKEYLQLLIEELTKTINSYELKKIRESEFHFQPETFITFCDGTTHNYLIEDENIENFKATSRLRSTLKRKGVI